MVGVLAMGLLVAGCGDDNDDASAAGSTAITKAVFVKQATAICNASGKKVEAEVQDLLNEPAKNQDSGALISEILIPGLEAQESKIRALGAPSGDEDEVEAIVTGVQQVIDHLEENPEKFSKESEPYGQAEKPADQYGLTACPLG